jgi:uncharacterized protein (TIGR01777 family)
MNAVFVILTVQALLGGFDNLWHHELSARLPQRACARHELALHAAREGIYGVVFLGLAWAEWHGAFALVLALLLAAEVAITLADFLEEDRTRQLPPLERVLHTVLAVCYGLFLATLAPRLWAWAHEATALVPVSHGAVSWLFTLFAAGLVAWSVRNSVAVVGFARAVSTPDGRGGECRMHRTDHLITPAVLVTGATGFVGSALVAQLRDEGRRLIVLSRDVKQARGVFGADVWVVDRLEAIPSETRIAAVVNLAGARVLGMPWTAGRRRTLLDSRVGVTAAVVDLMRRLEQRPRVLVSASAVGFYGASPNASLEPRDEDASPRPGQFQSDLCAAIEHEARRGEALGVRVVRMRFGVVLGRGDGAYPMLALAARLGLGAVLGSGRQPAPWIHLDDAVALIRFALADEALAGPVNAVAPDTRPQADFARALAKSFGRRAWLRVPYAPMRWALGEMAELLLEGQNAVPAVALRAGFEFRHPNLDDAFAALVRAPSKP